MMMPLTSPHGCLRPALWRLPKRSPGCSSSASDAVQQLRQQNALKQSWYADNCQPFATTKEKRDRKWYEKNIPVNNKSGAWLFDSCRAVYYLDMTLAQALSGILSGGHVVEMGAGCGCYTSALLSMGEVLSNQAFDGVPSIDSLTNGLVNHMDLSQPQSIPSHDWTLCMEVGEHVPVEFEDIFIDNVVQGIRKGVVLTWAPPGKGGHSHINERSNDYIISKMKTRGLQFQAEASAQLRSKASKQMFKKSLLVFTL